MLGRTDAVRDECTDEYNPYSMLLAVDRARLPDESALPLDDAIVDGITTYPLDAPAAGE